MPTKITVPEQDVEKRLLALEDRVFGLEASVEGILNHLAGARAGLAYHQETFVKSVRGDEDGE
jgi:hypothetical protein